VIEAFGGAGYVEDTGLPPLLRDAQVLPIWEGTTNVLSLDLLRGVKEVGGLAPLGDEFERCLAAIDAPRLQQAAQEALTSFQTAAEWLRTAQTEGPDALQAGARRFALTLGHALELAYTARHAQWSLRHEQDGRSAAAAERLAARPLTHITERDAGGTEALARGQDGSALSGRYNTPDALV
jgi:hypothetical protein